MQSAALVAFLGLSLASACEYRTYNYRLRFGSSSSYAEVSYQYPNGPNINVHRDGVVVQEIYLSDDLGKYIEQYPIANGFAIKGEDREIQVTVTVSEQNFYEFRVFRELLRSEQARDCLVLGNNTYWYGGPEQKTQQYWPIEKQNFSDFSYVIKSEQSMGVAERIWLNSKGVYAYVDYNSPLFISQTPGETLCFKAQKVSPYNTEDLRYTHSYFIGVAANPREAYLKAVEQHLGKPTALPDETMTLRPIVSTWARYFRPINEEIIRSFAQEIVDNDFKISQLEIDDFWEDCYGSLTVNTTNFPDMQQLTTDLKAMGFRVTMWIHPFINKNCQPWYDEAKSKGYFAADASGNTDTRWWNSELNQAGYIDFTNPEAIDWYVGRLYELRELSGVDAFKFDAGETSYLPEGAVLQGAKELLPNLFTSNFVNTLSQFGDFIEFRVSWGNQDLPVFVRMLDLDSTWEVEENGLKSMIPTLLQMNMNGYSFVLADMIGGNGYTGPPDKELYLRWMEVNTFMPALQYSFVPWDYDEEAVELALQYNLLHENVGPIIREAMQATIDFGYPVNPPIWWIAPEDQIALAIGDQFLLGEKVLVAPVIEKGAISRDIYLPAGSWQAPDLTIKQGPNWLRDYPAPIGELPYFVLQDDIKAKIEL